MIRSRTLMGVTSAFLAFALCEAQSWGRLDPLDEKALNAWWEEHPDPDSWEAALPEISRILLDEYREKREDVFENGTSFRTWFTHLQWVSLYPRSKDSEPFRSAFREIGSRPALKNAFIRALHPKDRADEALAILIRLFQDHPEDIGEYVQLAVAFAIVFDQDFPRNWPHHQVPGNTLPLGDLDVSERFAFYVRSDREGETEYDLNTLPAHLLKFAVDTKIAFSEFKWVREETKFDLRDLGEAFAHIQYDNPRAQQDIFDWPHSDYSLKTIRDRGGICVDQAYFAAQVGKTLGIPTLYFSGQGSGGGHAWFGFLEDEDEWRTDVGQYASQNYPVGNARDPQTWESINDAELALLSEGLEMEPGYQPARQALRFALLNREQPEYPALLDDARSWMPGLIEPWRAKAAWLTEQSKTEELKSHLLAWIDQFDKQTDLKVEGQSRLLEIYKAENHPEAEALQKDIVRQNRKDRFDLGIASGVGPVLEHIDAGNWDEAEKEYKRLIRRFDEQGGGNLFYMLVRPYFETCLEEKKWEYAEDALDYAEKKMEPRTGSILDGELKKLYEKLGAIED